MYNYTCNRLPKKNLLKKSSEIEFSSGDILTSKKSRFQRILNRVRGKKKREISPSYFITPWPNREFQCIQVIEIMGIQSGILFHNVFFQSP